jgi:hypothetical protein
MSRLGDFSIFSKNCPSHVICSQPSVLLSDYIVGGWFPCPHTVGNVASGWLFRMLATGVLVGVTMTLAAVVLCLSLVLGQFML